MSDPYLLAASLLTGGQLAAAPPPTMPVIQPDTLLALLNPAEEPTIPAVAIGKIAPAVENTSPEFSQPQLSRLISSSTIPVLTAVATPELIPSVQTLLKTNSAVRLPSSGSQLYSQRLAALGAGRLYTRVPADSFQSAWAKATNKPTYEQWKSLLAKEARAVAKGQGSNRLGVLVGDSLSLWFPTQRLPEGQLWLNQGISGDTSGGILRRLSAFSQTRPDVIYVLAGINDLRRGSADTTILENLHQITRRLKQTHPQAEVIVQSILPTRLATISNRRIRNLNRQIELMAQQQGATYLDIHSRFSDVDGSLRQELTTDGLHLSQVGYEVWQSALQQEDLQIALNRRR